MKTKLIQLPDYNIIVSDEEIMNDSTFLYLNRVFKVKQITESDIQSIPSWGAAMSFFPIKQCRKLIASDNPEHNLPSIDYSSLSEEDCKKIGYVDVKKLAKEEVGYYDKNDKRDVDKFIEGFKKAQSLNDKIFSLEDIEDIMDIIDSENSGLSAEQRLKEISNICKSPQQPKVFDVEVEMECTKPFSTSGKEFGAKEFLDANSKLKITNNSIKTTKIL